QPADRSARNHDAANIADRSADRAMPRQGAGGANGDVATKSRSRIGNIADLKDAAGDRGGTGKRTAVAVEHQKARILLDKTAAPSNRPGESTSRRLVEHQDGVVENVALEARSVPLQRAAADRRAARITISSGQNERASAGLHKAPRTRDA